MSRFAPSSGRPRPARARRRRSAWFLPTPGRPNASTFVAVSRKVPVASVSSCCTTGAGNLPVSSVANVLPRRQPRGATQPRDPALAARFGFRLEHLDLAGKVVATPGSPCGRREAGAFDHSTVQLPPRYVRAAVALTRQLRSASVPAEIPHPPVPVGCAKRAPGGGVLTTPERCPGTTRAAKSGSARRARRD